MADSGLKHPSSSGRGLPSSGRLPHVSSPSSGANDSLGASSSATSDLTKVLHPLNRSAEILCRYFDTVAVEVLAKLLQPERRSSAMGMSVSRYEQLAKPNACAAGQLPEGVHQVSSSLRAAVLHMGFIGVKRLLDAMWCAAFGTMRCDLELECTMLPPHLLMDSPPHILPPASSATPSPPQGPTEEIQRIPSRGLTTILMGGEDFGSRSPVTTNANTSNSFGTGWINGAPACNEDCKDHMSAQAVFALQREREQELRSICHCMEMHFNSVLLQSLQANLFPSLESAAPPSNNVTTGGGGANNAGSLHHVPALLHTPVGTVSSPSPPSVRPPAETFQRRHLCANNTNTSSNGSNPNASPGAIAPLMSGVEQSALSPPGTSSPNPNTSTGAGDGAGLSSATLSNLLAIAQVMDQRDDKGASLRSMTQEQVRQMLCVLLVHYHLYEVDVVLLYAVFLDTLLDIRQRVLHSYPHLASPPASEGNGSSTTTTNTGPGSSAIASMTTTELKPLTLMPHGGSSSPLVYQWFEKTLRSSFGAAADILRRGRVGGGLPSRLGESAMGNGNSGNGSKDSEEQAYRGSTFLPGSSGGSGESLFAARAHQFFKESCPMKYANPRLMHNSQKTPTMLQEGLTKASTFALHSTDLVYLQPSKNGADNEWAYSSKMWSIRTRLITLRGHYLYVYSAIASAAALTDYAADSIHFMQSGRHHYETYTYDSPIAVIDLSRSAGSSVYLVSGRHDIESVTLRTAGRANGRREQPLWSWPNGAHSSNNGSSANVARKNSSGLPSAPPPLMGVMDETEILRTYDTHHEVQLLATVPDPPSTNSSAVEAGGMANSTPAGDGRSAASNARKASTTSPQDISPPSAVMWKWLEKHHYRTIQGHPCPIRQRMYPIRLLCGNELHHFLFQSPGTRAKWYQFFEELTVMLHNKRQIQMITKAFCSLSAFLRNRIPYPVGPAAFESVSMLGAGTYGHVLLVRHKLTRKYFAMKVVRKNNFVSLRSIIEARRECSILQSLDCPYIMKLHDAYQTDTCVYFLLDFLSGGDLLKHIQSAPERHLSENLSRFIIAEVAIALEHLRVRGIVHRDLKGDNLVMDSEGHVVVTDFGFAKRITVDPSGGVADLGRMSCTGLMNSSLANIPAHSGSRSQLRYHMPPDEPGVVIPQHNRCGTVAYIAPEVLRSSHQGDGYGLEVDWWSLGVVFFTLLTGLFPFFKDTTRETTNEILHGVVRFPHEMRGGKNLNLSKEAQNLVLRLLEKRPEKRICRLKDLKQHPFFRGFDWEACEARRMAPPQELHVDMYPRASSSQDSVDRLKRRVEWATQQQLNPPEDPPLQLPVEDASPYQTSSGMTKEFDKHSQELVNIGNIYGMEPPTLKSVQNDIFHPLFARQERCGSDRDIFSMHHDALVFKPAPDAPMGTVDEELAEDYIPHAATTASSLGLPYGYATGDGTNMSGSFSIMGGAYRSVHSPTAVLGFSGTSAPIDVAFGLSLEETMDQQGGDSLVLNVDPIFEDFDEAAYQNQGIRETQYTRDVDTSMYRPVYAQRLAYKRYNNETKNEEEKKLNSSRHRENTYITYFYKVVMEEKEKKMMAGEKKKSELVTSPFVICVVVGTMGTEGLCVCCCIDQLDYYLSLAVIIMVIYLFIYLFISRSSHPSVAAVFGVENNFPAVLSGKPKERAMDCA
eukprot:gene5732-4093_t